MPALSNSTSVVFHNRMTVEPREAETITLSVPNLTFRYFFPQVKKSCTLLQSCKLLQRKMSWDPPTATSIFVFQTLFLPSKYTKRPKKIRAPSARVSESSNATCTAHFCFIIYLKAPKISRAFGAQLYSKLLYFASEYS